MPLIHSGTLKHLRIAFSFYLLPVFLFALSQAPEINWPYTILAFFILHLLVFPSSNGYNSYQDKDEASIGGLKHPPKVTPNLFYVTLTLDILAIVLGLLISVLFASLVLVFILMSRAYSYRKIRLKKYPIIGFLTVFIFQGAWVYLISLSAIAPSSIVSYFSPENLICMAISSLFLGSAYPLTQIYQHEADKNDGVISMSAMLGYQGTFVFSALLFSLASIFMAYYFELINQLYSLFVFLAFALPITIKLALWFKQVKLNTGNANFENTMSANMMNATCMNAFFIFLIINRFLNLI